VKVIDMKAYELRELSGPDGVVLNADRPSPQPGHGEVVIQVRAASLNYRDLLIASGKYGGRMKSNAIPLSDGAGEVAAVGEGVERVKVGDRVTGAFFPDWVAGEISGEATRVGLGGPVDGMLAEFVVLPERAVLPFPEHLSFEEAATLPCAALTAWNALNEVGRLRAGDTVLLQGAGGVSIFALQFARLQGATVILTSSSDEKLKRAAALGANHLINYKRTPEWDQEVKRLTGGRGVDLVVEVGGAGTLERSLRAVRVGGVVATIGLVAGTGAINPLPLIMRAIRLIGVYVGSHEMFAAMNRAISGARLRPVIDQVFPFDQATEAYRYQESGRHFGKVVIRVA
jgi:NADPH:quinone reductase-like Zn-dependent oxidoreductase